MAATYFHSEWLADGGWIVEPQTEWVYPLAIELGSRKIQKDPSRSQTWSFLGGSLRLIPESQQKPFPFSFLTSSIPFCVDKIHDFVGSIPTPVGQIQTCLMLFPGFIELDLSKNGVYPTAATWMEGDHNREELWYPIFRQIHFLLLFVHIFIALASKFTRTNNTLGCEIVRYHFKISLSLFRAGLPDYAMNWGSWIHARLCSLFHFQSFWQNLQIPPIVGGNHGNSSFLGSTLFFSHLKLPRPVAGTRLCGWCTPWSAERVSCSGILGQDAEKTSRGVTPPKLQGMTANYCTFWTDTCLAKESSKTTRRQFTLICNLLGWRTRGSTPHLCLLVYEPN